MGSSDGWMQPAVSTVSSRRRSTNNGREIHFLRVQRVSVMIITTISMRCFGMISYTVMKLYRCVL